MAAEYNDGSGFGSDRASGVSLNPVLSKPAVSNAGQLGSVSLPSSFAFGNGDYIRLGQAFTTGAASNGYLLREVRIGATSGAAVGFEQDLVWTVHADSDGESGAAVSGTGSFAHGDLGDNTRVFLQLVHRGIWLAPSTKYWLVMEGADNTGGNFYTPALSDEFTVEFDWVLGVPEVDLGAQPGWSLDSEALGYDPDGGEDPDDEQAIVPAWYSWAEILQIPGRAVFQMAMVAEEFAGPSAPRDVVATAGDGRVGLFWDAPEREGASAVVGYEYRHKSSSGSFRAWTDVADSDSDGTRADERRAVVSGLTSGGGTSRSVPVTIVDNDSAVSSVSVSSTPLLPLTGTKDTYGRGDTIDFAVQFTSAVIVTGTPTFTFSLNGTDTAASYVRGSGRDTLTFSHEVLETDSDSDGISWAANKLAFAGGTIVRVGTSTAATLTHSSQATLSGHKVDGTMSAVSAPSWTAAAETRSVAENTGSGNVGAPVAAAEPDGDTVYCSVSATGNTAADQADYAAFSRHFSLHDTTAQITIRPNAVLNFESRSSYSVTVSATDRETAAGEPEQPPYTVDDTVTLTVTLTNQDEYGTVTITGSPTGGVTLVASVSDIDRVVSVQSWTWSSSSTPTGSFTPIPGADQASYLVPDTDEGLYLRATAQYTDGHAAGKSEYGDTDTPVSLNAPENLRTVPGNTRVALSWDNPADSTITGYQYRSRAGTQTAWNPDWTVVTAADATTTTHVVTGLANLTEYAVELRAVRDTATGPASSTNATPEGPSDPALTTLYPYTYWTESADSTALHASSNINRLTLDQCAGTRWFRAIWSPATGHTAADGWQARILTRFGVSSIDYSISAPRPDIPELRGTVTLSGPAWLTIEIRGRYGNTYGTWSTPRLMRCAQPGDL